MNAIVPVVVSACVPSSTSGRASHLARRIAPVLPGQLGRCAARLLAGLDGERHPRTGQQERLLVGDVERLAGSRVRPERHEVPRRVDGGGARERGVRWQPGVMDRHRGPHGVEARQWPLDGDRDGLERGRGSLRLPPRRRRAASARAQMSAPGGSSPASQPAGARKATCPDAVNAPVVSANACGPAGPPDAAWLERPSSCQSSPSHHCQASSRSASRAPDARRRRRPRARRGRRAW